MAIDTSHDPRTAARPRHAPAGRLVRRLTPAVSRLPSSDRGMAAVELGIAIAALAAVVLLAQVHA